MTVTQGERNAMTARLRVSEAAQLAGVSPSTLRAWEASGLIKPSRTGRYRWFGPRDVKDLQEIASLRARGFNVAAIRSMRQGDDRAPARPSGRPPAGTRPAGTRHAATQHAGSQRTDSQRPGSQRAGQRPSDAPEQPAATAEAGPSLGEMLRAARHRRGLSLREASELAGLSVSHLSAIECGTRNASLAGLQRLAVTLKIGVSDLFGDQQRPPRRLVKATERPVLDTGDRRIRIESLSVGAQLLEPHMYLAEPGGGSQGAYHHDGEETVYVLEGEVEFWLNEVERHIVRAGDCLTFPSTLAHRWRNSGKDRLAMLWVNTPITFLPGPAGGRASQDPAPAGRHTGARPAAVSRYAPLS
jgi:DNA-binding transcriptional MerR regulator/quercetin dioxygenase-like cupin family protein